MWTFGLTKQLEAERLHHHDLGPEHLLVGLPASPIPPPPARTMAAPSLVVRPAGSRKRTHLGSDAG